MQIIIAGGTGLIGQALTAHLLKQGHTITIIGRSEKKIRDVFSDKVKAVTWTKIKSNALQNCQLVINLTGESINQRRWTEKEKHEIIESRTHSTTKLANLLCELSPPFPRWFNTSGVGIYGTQIENSNDELPIALDETAPVEWERPQDFMSTVATSWEKAAEPAIEHGVPVTFLRLGVVLAKQGGALPAMMRPFQFYIGGPIGSGRQPLTWIAIDDLIQAIDFLIHTPSLTGPINVASPKAVIQKDFAKILGDVIQRPSAVPMPAMLLKLLLGQMAEELLLKGQHVYPKRLLDAGFKFHYSDLETALNRILKK